MKKNFTSDERVEEILAQAPPVPRGEPGRFITGKRLNALLRQQELETELEARLVALGGKPGRFALGGDPGRFIAGERLNALLRQQDQQDQQEDEGPVAIAVEVNPNQFFGGAINGNSGRRMQDQDPSVSTYNCAIL